jgi:hypothetical protein
VRLAGEDARRAEHGVAVPAREGVSAGVAVIRLTDERGLIALAEPREGGSLLKPIVGLRG